MMRLVALLLAGLPDPAATAAGSPGAAAAPSHSYGLPGCCGMNWTDDDKRRRPDAWRRHLEAVS